jgi:hypothetical protein
MAARKRGGEDSMKHGVEGEVVCSLGPMFAASSSSEDADDVREGFDPDAGSPAGITVSWFPRN